MNIFKKTTSNRIYNKMRKRILLGKDDIGNKLYICDFVKLTSRVNIKSHWCSIIYWNPLNGAYVDSHPAHIAMNCGVNRTRYLSEFLCEKYDISNTMYFEKESERKYIPNCSIQKITYNEFLEWQNSIIGKYDSVLQANIKRREEATKD